MEWAVLFAFGTLWFWLLVGVATAVIIGCMEFERGFWATTTLVLTCAVLNVSGSVPIFQWVRANPWTLLMYVGIYFVAATAWGYVKWWSFVRNQRERYNEKRASFLQSNKVTGDTIPENLKEVWERHWGRHELKHDRWQACDCSNAKPEVTQHKSKVLMWMTYWPWSLVWTVLNDPVKKICKKIFYGIRDSLQKISDRAYSDTEQDFQVKSGQ